MTARAQAWQTPVDSLCYTARASGWGNIPSGGQPTCFLNLLEFSNSCSESNSQPRSDSREFHLRLNLVAQRVLAKEGKPMGRTARTVTDECRPLELLGRARPDPLAVYYAQMKRLSMVMHIDAVTG